MLASKKLFAIENNHGIESFKDFQGFHKQSHTLHFCNFFFAFFFVYSDSHHSNSDASKLLYFSLSWSRRAE